VLNTQCILPGLTLQHYTLPTQVFSIIDTKQHTFFFS